jgi:cobalt/nickel transport system permease protein
MVIITYLLLALSFMPGKEIIKILKVSAVMTLFTIVIMLPSAFFGSAYSVIMIPAKVFATITAVNMLSHSTQWNHIIGALKRFFVPDLFIFVLDITIKYIVMLGEFSLEMLYALKLRSVGKNRSKYLSLSGIAGTMFIKSKEMSEEMYAAMECRGFTGEYRVYSRFRLRPADFVYIAINAGILAAFIYLN